MPYVSAGQMIAVDRAMIEEYGISLLQMMENAGRCLANLARDRFLSGVPIAKRLTVMAGRGGNGGGALVAARRLADWGADVRVLLAQPPQQMSPAAAHQLHTLNRMGLECSETYGARHGDADVIIDGLLGYNLRGAPRGTARDFIDWANANETPVLALDCPSGLDSTTGAVLQPTIRATATMTLALPKTGLRGTAARPHVGELYVADIGVPPSLYERFLGVRVNPLFARAEVLRI